MAFLLSYRNKQFLSPLSAIALACFCTGSFLFLSIAIFWPVQVVTATATQNIGGEITEEPTRPPIPTHIEIAQKIDIPIVVTHYGPQGWQVSNSAASFPDTSARPGEAGNIVIYGHNWKFLFGPLNMVKKNDEVIIRTGPDLMKRYRIQEIITTSADDTVWIRPENKEVLTLYTCTGFFDTKRLIIRAIPVPES